MPRWAELLRIAREEYQPAADGGGSARSGSGSVAERGGCTARPSTWWSW